MNVDEARRLFSYTEWANARFFDCARGLTEEQFTRHVPSSFPTIRDTLAHMVFADWLWLRRWKGENPTVRPEWTKEASLETLETRLREIERERTELLARLTDDELGRDFAYRNMAGDPFTNTLGDLMTHVVNHGTYHRGQLTTMLRQVGATPPATDFVNVYLLSPK
jgi:uncharacterized damage-inducible protein DinB